MSRKTLDPGNGLVPSFLGIGSGVDPVLNAEQFRYRASRAAARRPGASQDDLLDALTKSLSVHDREDYSCAGQHSCSSPSSGMAFWLEMRVRNLPLVAGAAAALLRSEKKSEVSKP
jgi:hypothetical protein